LNLIKSAAAWWDGDYLIRSVDGYCNKYYCADIKLGSWPITEKYGTSWQHKDMPYQFKPFAIQEAIESGYTKILWCDSTIRLMRNPDPLWELCAEHGILAWDNEGHPLKDWISDWAIDKLGCDISNMKQIMACCIMFDTEHQKTLEVIEKWIDGSLNGSFQQEASRNPNYKGSRHDQAYLSALMQMYDISIQPYGTLAYPHYTPIDPTFINWGV
jgi:hypothetical protein